MKEINVTFTIKKKKLVETTRTKLNLQSVIETLFLILSLNVGRGSSKEIWPLRGFHDTILPILASSPS